MKKGLAVLGGVFLFLIVLAISAAGYGIWQASKLDKSSQTYLNENFPVVVANWSEIDLTDRGAPELIKAMQDNKEQTDKLYKKFAELGKLKSYKITGGRVDANYVPDRGKVVTVSYVVEAGFEGGNAAVRIKLIQHEQGWQFLLFNINSPIFLK